MDILPIVTVAATIRLVLAMASTESAKNTTPMHDLKTDPENAAQPESDLNGETERDLEDGKAPVPGDRPGDGKKLEDVAPPDGGAAAYLVVLGAWCCSFSSPGWVNSTCFPSPHDI